MDDTVQKWFKEYQDNQEVTLRLTLKRKEWSCVIECLQTMRDEKVKEYNELKSIRDKVVQQIEELKEKLNEIPNTTRTSN